MARCRTAITWRLYGTKWFTSATTSNMALTLARPEGNADGSRGLALFVVELRDLDGRLRSIRHQPTEGQARHAQGPDCGADARWHARAAHRLADRRGPRVRQIAPMLAVTRTWNAVSAVSAMRRGLALARDFARRRTAFGMPLSEKPLHADTLAGLEAEYAGAFCLAFRSVALLGLLEHGTGEHHERNEQLSRSLIPIAKLTTGKQAVVVTSEAIEACGGAGYVEDTGLPRILADAQVLPIWEGTTNVLSLDTLRALGTRRCARGLEAELDHAHEVADPGLAQQRGRAGGVRPRDRVGAGGRCRSRIGSRRARAGSR